MQGHEYRYSIAGMNHALRVTTNPDYYDLHAGSTELWSPGSWLFPEVAEVDPSLIRQLSDCLDSGKN